MWSQEQGVRFYSVIVEAGCKWNRDTCIPLADKMAALLGGGYKGYNIL